MMKSKVKITLSKRLSEKELDRICDICGYTWDVEYGCGELLMRADEAYAEEEINEVLALIAQIAPIEEDVTTYVTNEDEADTAYHFSEYTYKEPIVWPPHRIEVSRTNRFLTAYDLKTLGMHIALA